MFRLQNQRCWGWCAMDFEVGMGFFQWYGIAQMPFAFTQLNATLTILIWAQDLFAASRWFSSATANLPWRWDRTTRFSSTPIEDRRFFFWLNLYFPVYLCPHLLHLYSSPFVTSRLNLPNSLFHPPLDLIILYHAYSSSFYTLIYIFYPSIRWVE